MARLVLISDTHEQHEQVKIPPCDILVHAGDLTYRGQKPEIERAVDWLSLQPAAHVVFVAGNHDWFFERFPEEAETLLKKYPTLHYLENTTVTLMGVKFWGSPYTPRFFDWAFNCDRGDIQKHWDLIPADTDVLITHGPPQDICDQAAPHLNSEHVGCYDLRETVKKVQPKIHVFGHIHGGYGSQATVGTDWQKKPVYYNASVVNEAYKVVNKPFLVEV